MQLNLDAIADQRREFTENVIHVDNIQITALRQLETKPHLWPINLHAHGQGMDWNLPEGRLRDLRHYVVLPHGRTR